MDISRELAIKILKYLDEHKKFYFPFLVMCKEYTPEDNDFVEIEPNEWEMIAEDDTYQTFQLWENLQDLHEDTTRLLAKGFIEKIVGESLEKEISSLAKEYRKIWKEDIQLTRETADHEQNEFSEGSAEAYESCLDLIRKFRG